MSEYGGNYDPNASYGSYGGYDPSPVKHSLIERLQGIITFKPEMYREIAEDQDATMTAGLIIVIISVVGGFISGLLSVPQYLSALQDPDIQQLLGELDLDPASSIAALGGLGLGLAFLSAFTSPIFALIGWVIGSAIYAFITNAFFSGEATTGKMMRVFGHTSIFQLVGIVPCLGGLAVFVLGAISSVIGIRESARISTTNAVITWVIPLLFVILLFCIMIGLLIALVAAVGSAS